MHYCGEVHSLGDANRERKPVSSDFNIPDTESDFNEMVRKMIKLGRSRTIASNVIENRVKEFKAALKKYKSSKNLS